MFSEDTQKLITYKGEKEKFSDVFNNDPKLIFLHKKTERLTAALYMVTDLLSDKEPLRWSLRQQGLGLVATALSFMRASRGQGENEVKNMRSLLAEITALLQISDHAGIFSSMNVSILKQECEAIAELFSDPAYKNRNDKVSPTGTTLFPEDFFLSAKPDAIPERRMEGDPLGENNETKKEESAPRYPYGSHGLPPSRKEKATRAVRDILPKMVKDTFPPRAAMGSDKIAARRNSVLLLLRQKSPINVKDVAQVISDRGEKTIQRELVAMVDDGLLKKSGEKRWTTYSLA